MAPSYAPLLSYSRPPAPVSRHLAASPVMLDAAPFVSPTDWFVYGHLHFILALPTLTLLAISPPLQTSQPLQKQAAYAFVGFIVVVGVIQSLLWDSYGATLGIWEFNPAKCTLREEFPLPVEEVLWLFHHVLKTALYQLKAFELVPANTSVGAPSAQLRDGVSAALLGAIVFGVFALGFSSEDTIKCLGLVCAFFAPVWLLIWRIGGQFVLRHADRITWGWLAPGITTTLIDCLGQQQGVWRFPAAYLSGIELGPYLKLDVAMVYMVSTFAVTASGAVVLAATEELLARRAALAAAAGEEAPEPSLLDVGLYIFSGKLDLQGEGDRFEYSTDCSLEGCVVDVDEQVLPAGATSK
jgi:lycopene cyclase domain-containing protein